MRGSRGRSFPGGARLFHRMFTRLGCRGRPPDFVTEFYPYANLTHTIRLRGDTAFVRLSDLLRTAPLPVLESTAAILLARIFRRKLPEELAGAYRDYFLAGATRRRLMRIRRSRARRDIRGPAGAFRDLRPMFDKLNRAYFSGRLARPRLAWSARAWRTQLGCFDPALNQVILSSRLDQRDVPRSVVEYVLFHEMLHVKHPLRRARCGLQAHSPEFLREEKRFARYAEARRYLSRST